MGCDVAYRMWARWPLEESQRYPRRHTSAGARAAANRIVEILGLEVEDADQRPGSGSTTT